MPFSGDLAETDTVISLHVFDDRAMNTMNLQTISFTLQLSVPVPYFLMEARCSSE